MVTKRKLFRRAIFKNRPIGTFRLKSNIKRERFIPPNGLTVSELRQKVLDMQMQLAVALRINNNILVNRLINRIPRSEHARYYAVYRTISTKGSRSKGINDRLRPVTNAQYKQLVDALWKIVKNPDSYKATPLKRIYIPKPERSELRPISVPTYLDRALQHLYNFILTVVNEEVSEPNSFGFRPFRSPGWASKAITLTLWRTTPKYAIELDIEKCFDSISHDFIRRNIAKLKLRQHTYQFIPDKIIAQWLRSGYIDIKGQLTPKDEIIPTDQGVPQGGPISPTISNLVLNGIEKATDDAVRISPYVPEQHSISPKTKYTWLKNGIPILSTFNCNNQTDIYGELVKAQIINHGDCEPRYFIRYKRYLNFNLNFETIHFEPFVRPDPASVKESWNKTFRFADDCIIFVNSENAYKKALRGISSFLEIRGLKLNQNKTKIRNIEAGEHFLFVGFEYALARRSSKTKVYNFPPLSKIQNLRKKIKECLKENRYNSYLAFYKTNSIVRGWLNFYSCGNSKTIFQNISRWLWHKVYRYFWIQNRQNFKRSSQRIYKRKLSSYIFNRFLYPNLKWNKGKWWAIPSTLLPPKKRNSHKLVGVEPYYLIHPASFEIRTPGIITGLNAFHPEDRLILEEKAMSWKIGLQKKIISKSKGVCAACQYSLMDGETVVELHHIQPKSMDGQNTKLNLKALCFECHKSVTRSVKTKDLVEIIKYENLGILKNVSKYISITE